MFQMDNEVIGYLCERGHKMPKFLTADQVDRHISEFHADEIRGDIEKFIDKNIVDVNEVRCKDCVFKFRCLGEHHIPENYGYDCKEYKKDGCGRCGHKTISHYEKDGCRLCDCVSFVEVKEEMKLEKTYDSLFGWLNDNHLDILDDWLYAVQGHL